MKSTIRKLAVNFLFVPLLFITAIVCGQNHTIKRDTIGNGDTIVIYKSPLVISQKVYVVETSKPSKVRPYAELNIGTGSQFFHFRNPIPTVQVKDDAKRINLFTAEISYYIPLYKKLYIGLGLQVAKFKNEYTYQITDIKSIQTTTIVNDTLDTYIATNPKTQQDTVIYVIEPTENLQTKYEQQATTTNTNYSKTFLELPLHCRYAFQIRKFNIGFGGSLIPSFLISHQNAKITSNNFDTPLPPTSLVVRSANFSAAVNLDFGYVISQNLEIFTQASYRKEIIAYNTIQSTIQYHRTLIVGKVGVRMYL